MSNPHLCGTKKAYPLPATNLSATRANGAPTATACRPRRGGHDLRSVVVWHRARALARRVHNGEEPAAMCWERFLPLPWQTRMTTTSLLHNPPERHQGENNARCYRRSGVHRDGMPSGLPGAVVMVCDPQELYRRSYPEQSPATLRCSSSSTTPQVCAERHGSCWRVMLCTPVADAPGRRRSSARCGGHNVQRAGASTTAEKPSNESPRHLPVAGVSKARKG